VIALCLKPFQLTAIELGLLRIAEQGLALDGNRLIHLAVGPISGGQGVENMRPRLQAGGLLSQPQGPFRIAQRRVAAGKQQPGQIVEQFRIILLQFQGLVIGDQRLLLQLAVEQ